MVVKPLLIKVGKITLTVGLGIMLIASVGMIAYFVPNEAMTPLPYTWYMVGLRLVVVGYVYCQTQPKHRLWVLCIALLSEIHVYWLHRQAVEGLLW
ncbi:hypothetical protein C9J12_21095 [Photobacterium frigidiphilum]|uniref:Uncharacterized protein n=2 Tax=Photobacterium frigidiphilum TaxID=264736 RepID=A0A2T3JA73_9GAMM|nr:hypothetical protein C9J12_21095 [Photobacterium frigidiphilum]